MEYFPQKVPPRSAGAVNGEGQDATLCAILDLLGVEFHTVVGVGDSHGRTAGAC